MTKLFTKEMHSLMPGQAVSGVAAHPETLCVLRGRVWLTVEGVAHDYWLCAGDMFTAPPGRLVVIEGDLADSRLQVVATRHAADAPALGARLRSAVRRWLGSRQRNTAQACAACAISPAHR